ncbi:MAG: T9SS type A sorting domain-containing protein [Lentimicrobiaceae bacterium]|nr:T9SS type A sorting domain-containing protein [Lentimicrobiaceae bacterium]
MKNNIIRMLFAALFTFSAVQGWAEKYKYEQSTTTLKQTTAGCAPGAAFEWLDINNVRARINSGGDMWWDLPGGTGSKYFIPKNGSATSMYAGSLWIGGLDINNQLKLAAVRFRQVGYDWWTGPLTIDGTASIDEETCLEYDKLWKITRAAVDEFISYIDEEGNFVPSDDYTIPVEISEWPAHGDQDKGQSYYLAPFYDTDGDGTYNPTAGDYPYYDVSNELCHTKLPTMDESIEGSLYGSVLADQVIKGDQTLWWVFNDKGNSHTETQGSPIGLEIRAQAFAFATNDEINNMTFYSYEIINRSTYTLTKTYFSQWVDTDLGYAKDDYVGCDVHRGLGYCYNGSAVDGSGEPEAYGANPPAVGVDFFQGPYMDSDGTDNPKYKIKEVTAAGDTIMEQICDVSINGINFGNDIVDDERFGMRRFIYHNNSGGNIGDPQTAPEYYNLLRGIWRDGNKMVYGGTAYPGDPGTTSVECDFMFPGNTDPCNWGTGGNAPGSGWLQNGMYWTEETGNVGSPNPPEDRRFMQSAGPFTLEPGAVNYITVGIPWARATSGTAWASVELLRTIDDKAQALFDNCFKVIDGPSAPDLTIQEFDRGVIFYISNSPSSNNYKESYVEYDPNITQPHPLDTNGTIRSDSLYRFEGYQIFQLRDNTVGIDDIYDGNKARLVAQFDLKNGVGKLVNFNYDASIDANIPVIEVDGADDGIRHSFVLTQDAFAEGDVALINHKKYYYTAIAYGYNNYMDYSQEQSVTGGLLGQKIPYLAGRKNIKTYEAIPHKIVDGLVTNSSYGDGAEITRIAGYGSGGNELELTQETVNEILSKSPASETNRLGDTDYPIAYNPKYAKGKGPINVKVVNPIKLIEADYELWMDTLYAATIYNVTGKSEIIGDTAQKMVSRWFLKDMNTGEVFQSDTTTLMENELLFLDRGISITIEQQFLIGPELVGSTSVRDDATGITSISPAYEIIATNNGMITSSLEFADSSRVWLDGIRDNDLSSDPAIYLNWIRSGGGGQKDPLDIRSNRAFLDPNEVYEKIAYGTWAPYIFAAAADNVVINKVAPGYSSTTYTRDPVMFKNHTASVDIVFTSDKSKWTRCPVIEMHEDLNLAEGNATRFHLRRSPSIDKEGNFAASMNMEPSDNPEDPNYIAANGMGWFPGYAINIETGARLNMIYSEDSYFPDANGRDMQFNPTAKDMGLESQLLDPNIYHQVDETPVFGGRHFVYVMSVSDITGTLPNGYPLQNINMKVPAYDAGKHCYTILDTLDKIPSGQTNILKMFFYKQVMYVGLPMGVKGQEWLSNDARVKIRIANPYKAGYADYALDTVHQGMDINNYYPMYQFSTKGLSAEVFNAKKMESDLDLIAVVPNPYYGMAIDKSYEENALDNRIKIVNLPETCTVTIFNVSGTKIRQFKKDDPTRTYIDWDLKNFAGVPIASGIYLIHVKTNHGERVLKWYGALRQIDLNTF